MTNRRLGVFVRLPRVSRKSEQASKKDVAHARGDDLVCCLSVVRDRKTECTGRRLNSTKVSSPAL